MTSTQYCPKVTVRVGQTFFLIDALGIDQFWTSDKYVCFYANGNEHILDESLRSLSARLGQHGFLRVHRGALVNMNRVRSFRRDARSLSLLLESGLEVQVARRMAPHVHRYFVRTAMPTRKLNRPKLTERGPLQIAQTW